MSGANLITSGTQAIQTIRTGISWAASGIGRGISVIVGKTGLYNTTFWNGNGSTWKGVSGIWAKFAPFFKEVGVVLRTGYGTGTIFTVLSLFAFRSMISSMYNKRLFWTLASLVASVAFGMLAYVAFTYGTAMVVLG